MPNLKSQMKRAKTNVERQKANIPYKSGIKIQSNSSNKHP